MSKSVTSEKRREYSRNHRCTANYLDSLKQWNSLVRRLKVFGLTLDQYHAMAEAQNWQCAICGLDEESNGISLAIDHSHHTKKVRGLLCDGCNRGLGFFKDQPSHLSSAATYVSSNL